jgi:hypothetical protein
MSPGSEMKIPGLNSLGVHYRQLTMTRHNVISFLWRNGINILSSDEWIAFMDELRGPPVSEKANGMLNRIFSKQAGHALVEIHVALFTALAAVMVGAVCFQWMDVAGRGGIGSGGRGDWRGGFWERAIPSTWTWRASDWWRILVRFAGN